MAARAVTKFPAREPDEELDSRFSSVEEAGEPPARRRGLLRGKQAKAPKAEKASKAASPPREKKPSSPLMITLRTTALVSLLYILIIAGGAAALYFDLGGIREPVNRFFNMGDLAIEAQKSVLKDREDALALREKTLAGEKEASAALQAELLDLEKALDKRDKSLAESQQSVEELNTQLIGELENLEAAALIYERMDPATAAEVLIGIENNNFAVRVLKRMKPASAAKVLENMSTEDAVTLMALMG